VKRFTTSRVRGWRWLFVALGLTFGCVIVFALLNAAETMALRDAPILVFPALILGFSLALLYLGIFARDEIVELWVSRLTRWAR
jgi:hypothetical protein